MKKNRRRKPPKKITRKKAKRRNALERATAAYFASLSGEALEEERRLEAVVASTLGRIDFDADYD
jgi:hypothetical protein